MSESESDSGPEDRNPPKKAKADVASRSSNNASKRKHDAADASEGTDGKFLVGPNRYVTVSSFKGKARVDIREFYTDNAGEEKPGRKGISLSIEQYQKLKSLIPKIDEYIKNM